LILHWGHQYRATKKKNVSFQRNQGAEEVGDEVPDFPHSLKLADEYDYDNNNATMILKMEPRSP
jgi:hypothetical protein